MHWSFLAQQQNDDKGIVERWPKEPKIAIQWESKYGWAGAYASSNFFLYMQNEKNKIIYQQ